MRAYQEITNEEFDKRLKETIEDNASALLLIAGVYEIVSEYYNNDILEDYEDDNEHFLHYHDVVEMFSDGLSVFEMQQKYNHDDIMLREDFNNYTDMLCKNGEISDWAYNNWDNPY